MRYWRHARAGLVLLVMTIALADGCPIPPAKYTSETFMAPRDAIAKIRKTFMRPFRPVGALFNLRQHWKLFPTAKLEQFRMHIEAREKKAKSWTLLYRPLDDDADFMADAIEYRRLRGPWNPGSKGTRTSYGPFAQWIARQVFKRYPNYYRVRVKQEKIVLEPRKGRYHSTGKFEHEKFERPNSPTRRIR